MPPRRSTSSFSEVLPGVLGPLKPSARVGQEEIQQVWRRLVVGEAAEHSWPRRLCRRRLWVEVDSSGWMYALHLKRAFILEGLMELLGARRVNALSFRIGEKHAEEG